MKRFFANTVILLLLWGCESKTPNNQSLDLHEEEIIESPNDKPVTAVKAFHNTVYFATEDGKIFSFDPADPKSRKNPGLLFSAPNEKPIGLIERQGDELYYGLRDSCLRTKNSDTTYRIPIQNKETKYSSYSICFRHDTLFLACSNGVHMFPPGLYIGEKLIYHQTKTTDDNRFYSLYFSHNSLYAAGESGLYKINLKTKEYKCLDPTPCYYIDAFDDIQAYILGKEVIKLLNTTSDTLDPIETLNDNANGGLASLLFHVEGTNPKTTRLIALGVNFVRVDGKQKNIPRNSIEDYHFRLRQLAAFTGEIIYFGTDGGLIPFPFSKEFQYYPHTEITSVVPDYTNHNDIFGISKDNEVFKADLPSDNQTIRAPVFERRVESDGTFEWIGYTKKGFVFRKDTCLYMLRGKKEKRITSTKQHIRKVSFDGESLLFILLTDEIVVYDLESQERTSISCQDLSPETIHCYAPSKMIIRDVHGQLFRCDGKNLEPLNMKVNNIRDITVSTDTSTLFLLSGKNHDSLTLDSFKLTKDCSHVASYSLPNDVPEVNKIACNHVRLFASYEKEGECKVVSWPIAGGDPTISPVVPDIYDMVMLPNDGIALGTKEGFIYYPPEEKGEGISIFVDQIKKSERSSKWFWVVIVVLVLVVLSLFFYIFSKKKNDNKPSDNPSETKPSFSVTTATAMQNTISDDGNIKLSSERLSEKPEELTSSFQYFEEILGCLDQKDRQHFRDDILSDDKRKEAVNELNRIGALLKECKDHGDKDDEMFFSSKREEFVKTAEAFYGLLHNDDGLRYLGTLHKHDQLINRAKAFIILPFICMSKNCIWLGTRLVPKQGFGKEFENQKTLFLSYSDNRSGEHYYVRNIEKKGEKLTGSLIILIARSLVNYINLTADEEWTKKHKEESHQK